MGAYGHGDRIKWPTNMSGVKYQLPKIHIVCDSFQFLKKWGEAIFSPRHLCGTTQLHSISCNTYIQANVQPYSSRIVPHSSKYGPKL